MKLLLFSIKIFILNLNLKFLSCFQLHLKLMKSEKHSDIGLLMGKKNGVESLFIKFKLFELNLTNLLCKNLGYDPIHSISLPYKMNNSYSIVLNLKFNNANCCELFVN